MYRYLLYGWMGVGVWASCFSGSSQAPEASSAEAAIKGPVFRRSVARPVKEAEAHRNWCLAEFSETEIFGADTTDSSRRFFYLQPGVTWLTVGDDLGRANLFLRPLPEGDVEIFTGEHFPRCLSRPEYVWISAQEPHRFQYDNRQYIRFFAEVQADAGALRVSLTFPPKTFFAVTALRCPRCGL